MKQLRVQRFLRQGQQCWCSLLGAITFYTCIPIPASWGSEFHNISRWAPLVGLVIGGILSIIDAGLEPLGLPSLTRSALIVVSWLALTGGLHLDGAMDTSDGLGVCDPKRRLEVMADSHSGAFGVMTAVAVLLLKTAALSDIVTYRWLALMTAAGWGRWGQVVAIAFYPYLKPTGKGAFHKKFIRVPQDILWGGFLLLGVCGLPWFLVENSRISLVMMIGGSAIAFFTGVWFYRQLGGHTGDTYGAVVEWTEALFLCFLTSILR